MPQASQAQKISSILGWTPDSWTFVDRGYTPAARYMVTNGARRAFVKIATNAGTAAHMRREIRAYSALCGPFMPRCYGWDEAGENPLVVIEDLSSADWPPPWTRSQVEAVLRALSELHAQPAVLPPYSAVHGNIEGGWVQIRRDSKAFLSLGLAAPSWLARNIEALIEAEANCSTEGNALTHLDVRSDNLCVKEGSAILVDWGEACLSNPKLDLGFWLPSLASEGGPRPEDILSDAPDVAAWVAGFFAARAGLPDLVDAPFVRRVQKEQLVTALPWACRELKLSRPLS